MPLAPPHSESLRREVEEANARYAEAQRQRSQQQSIAPSLAPAPEQIAARSKRVAEYETQLSLQAAVIEHNAKVGGPRATASEGESEEPERRLSPQQILKREVDKLNKQRQRDGYFLPKKEK